MQTIITLFDFEILGIMRIVHIIVFSLLLFLIQTSPLFAVSSESKFEHITNRSGLSQNHVNTIFQDRTGFLWFGTFNGLNRYDGYNFKIFTSTSNDETTLSQNSINVLFQDKAGNIWVGTEQGLNKFDASTETFTRYFNLNSDSVKSAENNIRTIYEDANGVFWIGFYGGGLKRFYPNEGRFEIIPDLKAYLDQQNIYKINAFYADKKGYFWLGTEFGGLVQYHPLSHQIVSFTTTSPPAQRISDNIVTSITEDGDGAIWIGTWAGGINKLELKTGKITIIKAGNTPNSLPSNIITSLIFDKEGYLWASTFGKGVTKIDIKSQVYTNYHNDPSNINSLNHDVVWRIFQDREGVFWLGTYGGGVNKLVPEKNNMKSFRMDEGRSNWLNQNFIFSFCETSNHDYLLGTFGGGINIFNRSALTFKYLLNDSTGSGKIIRVIYEDKNKNIWVSTDKALYYYTPTFQLKHCFKYHVSNTGIGENAVYSIVEDKDGNFWFGLWMSGVKKLSKSELNKISTDDIRFEQFKDQSFYNRTVWAIYQDQKNDIWIGTNNSLVKFDYSKQCFIDYAQQIQSGNKEKDIAISSFYEDTKRHKLWFGTLGSGLGCFDYNSESFNFITSKQGLAHDEIFAVHSDGKDNIWISSSNGLSQYNQSTNNFRNFDIANSDSPNELLNKSWMLSTGEILVSGNSGFYIFNPLNVYEDIFVSPIVITDFRIFNKSVFHLPQNHDILKSDLNSISELTIGQNYNVFSFQFSVLDFRNPNQNEYQYMLEGFDKDWTITGAGNRVATYTNLDAGTYTFKVKGCNSDGIWSNTVKEIKVKIVPPFYKTWYFRLLLILVLLGVLFYLFLLKFKTISEKVKAKIVDFNYKKIETENIHLTELTNELENDLDEKSKELATLRLFMQEREDNLQAVKTILSNSVTEGGALPKSKTSEIISLLAQGLKEKNSWDAFKENIDVLQNDFIKKLALQYPKLTQKDLIVCAYIKMAKSNKDMANHLNISIQSIEMTRYRIRKKMELNSKISLNDFLIRY